MEQEYIKCNICGKDETEFMFEKEDFKVVKCVGCGLVYQNLRPKIGALKEIYEGEYSEGYISKAKSKKRRAKKIMKGILKHKKNGDLLDIGSSAGFILEAARNLGFKTQGVEISPVGLKYSKEVLKLDVFDGFLQDAKFPLQKFDVVTIYHVIEHVPDPVEVFTEIERILKPDGLLEIWTPDIGHRNARKQKQDWTNVIREHIYYFDIVTLSKVLEKSGLRVKKNQFTFKDGLKVYACKATT